MVHPWKQTFNDMSLHRSLKDAIKALMDWLQLSDAKTGNYVVTVIIEKKVE